MVVNEFLSKLSTYIWLEFHIRDQQIMLLRICEFRENQQNRGGGTLHRGVQEITFTRIPRNRITFQK